jgi:hypothetical protein
MKFTVKTDEMIKAIAPASAVAEKDALKEYVFAENIKITASEDNLSIIANGGNAMIESIFPNKEYKNFSYTAVKNGSVTVNAKMLLKALVSFPSTCEINFSIKSGQLLIDGEIYIESEEKMMPQVQSVAMEQEEVSIYNFASKFDQEIDVNRECFISGMDKVYFAIGYEESKPTYLAQLFEADKDGARFISGSGARFAVMDIFGKNVSSAKEKISIIFPKNNLKVLLDILKNSGSTNISITKSGVDGGNYPAQITITFDAGKIALLGIDTSLTEYTSIKQVFSYDYGNILETNLEDWTFATSGMHATIDSQMKTDNIIHNAIAKLVDNHLEISSDAKTISNRIVSCFTIKKGENSGDGFKCNSPFLQEMVKEGDKKGTVQLKYDAEWPIFVKYPEVVNLSKETKEQLYVFFATTKK